MSLFWGTIALFGTLLPPIFYLLPVLWFYSFFHTHNLNSMSDEEFYTLEDDYLFHIHPQKSEMLSFGVNPYGDQHHLESPISRISASLQFAWPIFNPSLFSSLLGAGYSSVGRRFPSHSYWHKANSR